MVEQVKENRFQNFLPMIGFLIFSTFAAFVVGLIFGVVGYFIYLIFVFPIIMGVVGGRIVTKNANYTKPRSLNFVIFTSVLAAIALYGGFHYGRYVVFMASLIFQLSGDFSDKSIEAGKVFAAYALGEETGYSGLIGYILYKAQQGVSIGRIFSSNRLNLGPLFTWFYWLVEFGVIGFITINTGKQILKKPFCEHCNSWYAGKTHIGGVHINKETEVLNLIGQKDFRGVGTILEENPESPSLEFYLQSCESCNTSASFLSITQVKFVNGKLVSKDISETTLTPTQKKSFFEEIKFLKK